MTLLFIYLAIAIGVSFVCSVLEAVLLSITPSFVQQMNVDRPARAKTLVRVKDKLDESLSSILILNTFAHTMGAAGVGAQAIQVFGAEWETLIAVLLTLAILYFSEIIPKTLGAKFWRQLAMPAAITIFGLVKLVYPLVWLSTRLTRLFGKKKGNEVTRKEIIALASLGHQDGTLFSQENDYLTNLFNLRDVSTEDILTPRSVVHMLQADVTVSDALDDPETQQFSRMPIYGENPDDVQGKVLRADLFQAERDGHGSSPVKQFSKKIMHVSEKLPVYQLLDSLIKQSNHLCLVDDEFGQTAGVVTLEDAIETLLGREIVDESDAVADMQALARARYRNRLKDGQKNDAE